MQSSGKQSKAALGAKKRGQRWNPSTKSVDITISVLAKQPENDRFIEVLALSAILRADMHNTLEPRRGADPQNGLGAAAIKDRQEAAKPATEDSRKSSVER